MYVVGDSWLDLAPKAYHVFQWTGQQTVDRWVQIQISNSSDEYAGEDI